MAAGDFLILRNDSSVVTLPNTGSNLDSLWDTEVIDEGSAATYSAGTFTLSNTAPYLIMYSERFNTTDTTNNERIEGNGRIRYGGADLIEGAGEGYIRKSSDDQDMVISGAAIVNATANDTFLIRFYRGDNSTTGTVTRVPDFGGVQIIELDAADNFATYTTTSSQTLSSTESNVTNWTNTTQETGFSRTTDTVTLSNAGRYLMVFSGATSETGTARLGATIFAENGTTEITGVRGYSHMRGSDSNQNGALSFTGLLDVAASDTITLRGDADSGSMTLASGAKWQFWQLPSGNETAIMEATTGNMNADAIFTWDTLPHIDTGGFTATAGNSNIDVDQGCHLLAFWNQGKKVIDTLQRASPMGQVSVNGSIINHSASSSYHRNSGSIGTFMVHSGAAIVPTVPSGSEIEIKNTPLAATGNIDVESGHFSLINLEGLYQTYTYDFPVTVTDVDTDEIVTNSQTNVVITGTEFEATQGTGKVELVQYSTYTGTKITQSIDSWSDTSIQIDITSGALADSTCFLFVTSDSAKQGYIAVTVGVPPETYQEAIEGMTTSPSHYWMMQNSYADEIGSATMNNSTGGTPSFETTIIVKGDTHSFLLNATNDYVSPADQSDMNITVTAGRRYIGGWFQVDRVSPALAVLYEEGAQINNFALLNGFGNALMFQFADDGGDYVQTYSDIKLTPNRPYLVLAEFNSSTNKSGVCKMHLDGVAQSRSNGNPWEETTFPSHSGNITWGHEGTEVLQIGDSRGTDQTDIAFTSPVECNYAHWFNWTDVSLNDTSDIRTTLFAKGALADTTILTGTESAMQTSIDAEADTEFPDWPCGLEISKCSAGDFELTFDNITFDDRCSMPIRYMGADTLTIILTNGSALDSSKCEAPYGGTITFINSVPITIVVRDIDTGSVIQGARVRLVAGAVGPLTEGDVIVSGTTDVNGEVTDNMQYSSDQAVTGAARKHSASPYYAEGDIVDTIGSTGKTITVYLIPDE